MSTVASTRDTTHDIWFYVLNSASWDDQRRLIESILVKSSAQHTPCLVVMDDEAQVNTLSHHLWQAEGLLPHVTATQWQARSNESFGESGMSQVSAHTLASAAQAQQRPSLWPFAQKPFYCLNLSSQLPAHWQQAQRVIEILDQDENRKRLAREKFKQYRQQGIEPQTHHL